MEVFNKGQYSGKVILSRQFEDAIVTHTQYGRASQPSDWHYHENLHICFVFQGGRSDTVRESRYTEKGGSIFFYHAAEKHRWTASEAQAKSANIELGRQFLEAYNLSEEKIHAAINKRVDAKTLFLKIQKEILSHDNTSDLAIQSLLLELVSMPVPERSIEPPRWVAHLQSLLNAQWNDELTLNEIAAIIQVHPVTISKYFRKYFCCTLGEYRRKLKIEKSIELIKSGDKSLSEIAYYCNFADQSHFTRNFKASTGFLPKDFRSF